MHKYMLGAVLLVTLMAWHGPARADGGHRQHGAATHRGQHSSAVGRSAEHVYVDPFPHRPFSLSSPWRTGHDSWTRSHRSPGLTLGYRDGNFSGSLTFGARNRAYCSPHYYSGYDPYYGWPSSSYYVGGRPVYVFGDTRSYLDLPVRTRGYSTVQVYTPADDYADNASADQGPEQVPVTTYNDNRVTNNYYGPSADTSGPVVLPQNEQVVAATPGTPAHTAAVRQSRPFGQRFIDKLRLDTADGAYQFVIRDGTLYGGLASAKAQRISDNADAQFGGFAVWLPGEGVSVLYREGDGLFAAYPTKDGWAHDPLPYIVRFGADTSVGLVNGLPWAVFNTTDGQRYVVQYGGHRWTEVGSAKAKPGAKR